MGTNALVRRCPGTNEHDFALSIAGRPQEIDHASRSD
jgi:hypothetical protein